MHPKQQRRCVACRTSKFQNEMIRIAKIGEEFIIDEKNKLGGRGAYICKDKNCIDLAIKKRLLNRAYKMNIETNIYEKLGEYEKGN